MQFFREINKLLNFNTMWKSRQKHYHHFFRQVNVFTKELISRKFLSVITFYIHCSVEKLRIFSYRKNFVKSFI